MKGRGFNPLLHRPLDGTFENVRIVLVHTEDEAGVDHHTEIVKSSHHLFVVTP